MSTADSAFPFPTAENHPANPTPLQPVERVPSEPALDHGIEESFPASDPVSVGVSQVVPKPAKADSPRALPRPKAVAHALSKGGALVGFSASFAVGLALGRVMERRARARRF